jgi:hypothetical protein
MKSPFTTIRFALTVLALATCTALPAAAQFDIEVADAQFSTYVMVERPDGGSHTTGHDGHFSIWPWGISRATNSSAPMSDEIYGPESGLLNAQANAEWSGVAAYSSIRAADAGAGAHNATAGAESQIWFSPLTTGTATIQFDFVGEYAWAFSACFLSLTDTTSDQTLWDYEWSDLSGPFPFSGNNPDGSSTGLLSYTTSLSSEKNYELDMFVQTFSNNDVERVSVQLSGLRVANVIPEPSSLALVGFGAAILLTARRTRGVPCSWSCSPSTRVVT